MTSAGMEVLQSCRRVFRFFHLCDKNLAFSQIKPIDIIWHIYILCCVTTIVTGMIAFCVTQASDLQAILTVSYTLASAMAYEIIYFIFLLNRSLIKDLFKNLEKILIERVSFNPGIREMYEMEETKNANLTKKLVIYSWFVVVSLFIFPFASPVLFIFFGTPQPDLWSFPFYVV